MEPDIIPKVIMQTSKETPCSDRIPEYLKKILPEYSYVHFNDEQILEFMDQNPIREIPDPKSIIQSFTVGQHKADFFRLYYLYINGGIFLDSDAMVTHHMNSIIDRKPVFIRMDDRENSIFNGFIAITRRHDLMKKALIDASKVNPLTAEKYYFIFCDKLWESIQGYDILLFDEHKSITTAVTRNNDDRIFLIHYFITKYIPMSENPLDNVLEVYTDVETKLRQMFGGLFPNLH